MASSFTGLGTELMTTGENAGTWGTTTNTNLQIIEQLAGGYVEQAISSTTTTLSVSDGSTGATLSHRIIKFTGTLSGNSTVTVPLDVQQMYILMNGTSGTYTLTFKYVSGSGSTVAFGTTDKGTKIVYATADHASNPNMVDTGISTNTLTGVTGDITIDSPDDLVLDAAGGNIEFKDAGTTQLTLDMDTTSGVQILKLGVDSDDLVFQQYDGSEVVRMADDRRLYFYDKGGEYIYGDGTDLHITSGADINIPANIGLTFGDDGEKIEGDGTDLTITGNTINLTATTDVALAANTGLLLAGTEKLESDGTDLSITVGAGGDINIGTDIGLTFGDDGEKIEGDGTDLTITGNTINLTATTDVVLAANTGIVLDGSGNEKIESDGTDISISVGSSGDINVPANIGVTFGDDGEKIEGDGTDLTISASADLNLTATTDINIPANVGLTFGDDGEKIEGDGTDLTIAGNNVTVDAAADIVLDAAGNNLTFKSGGTAILDISNSSSDAVIQPKVDAKDIIFKQYDGNILLTIDDAGFVGVHNSAAGPGELRIYEDTDNGSNYVGFKAGNVTTAVSWVLPVADGSDGQVMKTDGSGNLTFTAQSVSSLAADDISAGDAAVTIGNASTSADVTIDSGDDVVIDAAGGNVEFKDAGTLQLSLDMDGTAGVQIVKLGVDSDDLVFQQYDGNEVMRINDDRKLYFYDDGGENISSDGTDFTFASGNDINLTATADINVPSGVGMTFGNDGEKIEGDGTDLTIAGNNINLTAVADVVIPANVGITFGSGEKIEGDSTDLTVTSGGAINLTATTDVVIPNSVGIQFGGASEKIEGDGTDLVISANNLTVDAAADIILDAAGNNVIFKSGGTSILDISNSSSDAVITASVQDKDIIFKGDDGGSAVTALTLDMSAGGIATFSAAANVAQQAITSSSNAVAWDASDKPNAYHITTENTTFSAPSNAVEGAFICLEINYNGSHTIGWNTVFEFAASTEPTETATDAKTDIHVFRYNGAIWQEVGRTMNLSES